MRNGIIILSCLAMLSCATSNRNASGQAPESWQGKSASDLKAAMGTPIVTNIQSNGNTAYTYVTRSVTAYVPPVHSEITTIALPHGGAIGVNAPTIRTNVNSTLAECVVIFEANKQGVIMSIKKRGSGC
jgi:hypothetical protein